MIAGLISSYFGMLRGQDTYFQVNNNAVTHPHPSPARVRQGNTGGTTRTATGLGAHISEPAFARFSILIAGGLATLCGSTPQFREPRAPSFEGPVQTSDNDTLTTPVSTALDGRRLHTATRPPGFVLGGRIVGRGDEPGGFR